MEKEYLLNGQGDMRMNIRQTIIDMMKTIDVSKITVGAVAQRAYLSRSSFYRYYGSVDEVVKEMEEEVLQEIKNVNRLAMYEKLVERNTELYQNMLARSEILKKYSEFITVITGVHGDPQFSYRAIKLIREYLLNKLTTNEKMNSLQIEFFSEFMAAGWYHLINYWLTKRADVEPEQFIDIQYQYFNLLKKLMGINDKES